MRVISGEAKGIRLNTLDGLTTRPTLDRVKESLFSILQFNIQDSDVLDLFAGSGALGIEALSRGAKSVTFCDKSIQAIEIINENLNKTKIKKDVEVIHKDYTQALKSLSNKDKKFDIIFLDPPYKADFAIKALKEIIDLNLIAKDGIIIIETDDKLKIEEIFKQKNAKICDTRKYGKVMLIFIRKG